MQAEEPSASPSSARINTTPNAERRTPNLIPLHPSANISAPFATLADITDLAADDPRGRLSVAELPDLMPRTLDATAVRQALGKVGVDLVITGTCRIVRASTVIDADALLTAARTAIVANGDELALTVVRPPTALAIPAGEAPELLATALDRSLSGDIPVVVKVRRDGREWGRAVTTLHVERFRQVPVAARPLRRGEVLAAADIASTRCAVDGRERFATRDAIAGMVLRYDLAAGTPFVTSALMTKRAVRGGTPVRLVARSDHFDISAPGIALADGDIGDRIPVRRVADGRTAQARISAPDEAVVDLNADQGVTSRSTAAEPTVSK